MRVSRRSDCSLAAELRSREEERTRKRDGERSAGRRLGGRSVESDTKRKTENEMKSIIFSGRLGRPDDLRQQGGGDGHVQSAVPKQKLSLPRTSRTPLED